MSSLSRLPYGKVLDYWYEKLSKNPYRTKFLLTKFLEIAIFNKYSSKRIGNITQKYCEFPKRGVSNARCTPIIGIVIPVYLKTEKDINNILNLLVSIERQVQKPDYIIVIDDCSPLSFVYPDWVLYQRLSDNSGPAKARNVGKQIALDKQANIIAFTDVDCILRSDWIAAIVTAFKEEACTHIFSGDTESLDKKWFGIYHNINGTLNGRRFKNSERLLYGTTANLAISRDVALNVDFNEKFLLAAGEDIEFCFRANQHGFDIKYIPDMVVYHNYNYGRKSWENIQKFKNQFKKYAYGEVMLLKEVPEYYLYFDETEEISSVLCASEKRRI